jgi:hypothetical protein
MSFKTALEEIGCGPCYHFTTLFDRPEHIDLWQAIDDGRDVGWDRILAGYNSAVDWPASAHYEQLMVAYPEAKVILTVREPERWYESFKRTVLWVSQQEPPLLPPRSQRLARAYMERIFEGGVMDPQRAIAGFQRWNRDVQECVPGDRLLVFDVRQGWEPLCRFLDVPVPVGKAFPRLNDTAAFMQLVLRIQSSLQEAV